MTVARALNIDRESAAKYSFMLSGPIVLAATIFKLGDFVDYFKVATMTGMISFIIGVITSFIVGMIVIKFLLKYLQKGSFKVFAVYRMIIGVAVLLYIFL